MRSKARRLLPPLFALLLLASTLALTGARPEPPFSRARWIAERMDRYHFDGGVIPANRESLLRFAAKAGRAAGEARAAVERSVRVSRDILGAEGASEPETQTEAFFAIDPANERNLLAGYQEGRFADGGARGLTYAVSSNGGRSWREGVLPGLTRSAGGPFQRASDPWVAFGPGNRAYYASLAFNETDPLNGIYVSASADGGKSWGDPVAVHVTETDFDDKESVVVDSQADSPYRGRVYVAWDRVTRDAQVLMLATSEDGGRSFNPPVEIERTGFNIGVLPLIGPGGRVHAIWSQFQGRRIALLASRSDDGGATWSAPREIADLRPAGIDGFRTGDVLATAAIDPATGALYAAWQDERFTPGVAQIVLIRSTDGGESWTAPARVSDGPADAPAFTPALAVDRLGRVGVCYSTLRNDPSRQTLVDQYCSLTRKRGGPFLKSQRVNANSFDIRFAAVADEGFFLGDYSGLVGSSLGFSPLYIATIERSARNPNLRQPDAFTRLLRP